MKGRLDLKVSDLGLTQLKNIAEPVRVYTLEVGAQAHAKFATPSGTAGPSAARAPRKRSGLVLSAFAIALLLAAGAAAWHFLFWCQLIGAHRIDAVGRSRASLHRCAAVHQPFLATHRKTAISPTVLRENLTTDLSRLQRILRRRAQHRLCLQGQECRRQGDRSKELGVRYVLEGSVQRDQTRVRVNAQLIDAETGGHLWAERFEKPLADLFDLQDEIVASLASQLRAELITNEARFAQVERTPNPDLMDLYFQGNGVVQQGAKSRRYCPRARFL